MKYSCSGSHRAPIALEAPAACHTARHCSSCLNEAGGAAVGLAVGSTFDAVGIPFVQFGQHKTHPERLDGHRKPQTFSYCYCYFASACAALRLAAESTSLDPLWTPLETCPQLFFPSSFPTLESYPTNRQPRLRLHTSQMGGVSEPRRIQSG